MTLTDFSTYPPATAGLSFFVDTNKVIKGINISTTACNNISTYEVLNVLEKITVPIEGVSYTFNIIDKEEKNGYFFFTVEDKFISNLTTPVTDSNVLDCTLISFSPSTSNATFLSSDYNALINNATLNRLNSFMYNVDRNSNQVIPSNYLNIISGSADYAEIPDSNFTSIGFTNGRYTGTKTTAEDFGIPPALGLGLFEAATYTLDKTDRSICSQSFSERKSEELLFAPSLRFSTSDYRFSTGSSTVEDLYKIPYIKKKLLVKTLNIGFNSSTNFLPISGTLDVTPNDYLLVVRYGDLQYEYSQSNYEYVKVTSTSYNPSTNITTINIEHKPFYKYGDRATLFYTEGQAPYGVYVLLGDTIYKPNRNQLYRLTDKKLYVLETNTIYILNEKGQLVYKTFTCSG